MRALEPDSDYIVVRSAKNGFKHEHVFLKDLDKILEGIGGSAQAPPAAPSSFAPEALQLIEHMTEALAAAQQTARDLAARVAALEEAVDVHTRNFAALSAMTGAKE